MQLHTCVHANELRHRRVRRNKTCCCGVICSEMPYFGRFVLQRIHSRMATSCIRTISLPSEKVQWVCVSCFETAVTQSHPRIFSPSFGWRFLLSLYERAPTLTIMLCAGICVPSLSNGCACTWATAYVCLYPCPRDMLDSLTNIMLQRNRAYRPSNLFRRSGPGCSIYSLHRTHMYRQGVWPEPRTSTSCTITYYLNT